MKRVKNIYKDICDINNIIKYEHIINVNTKNKNKVEKYEEYYTELIYDIKNTLESKKYIPGKFNIFFIYEPKLRLIMSNNIKDKIINHLVAKYLLSNVLDKTFINTTVATRIGMGTHYGLNLLKRYINNIRINNDSFYYLKFDIEKYFYNIDHNILKKMIKSKIKDKDALHIIFNIIDSTDYDYINIEINKLKNKEINRINKLNISSIEKGILINNVNNIPFCKRGKSLPIGSMCSQILAIFYLDGLNHYIKEKLHIKYYILYMDDGIILHQDKEYLKYCKVCIEKYLNDNLLLNFNYKKTYIHNIKNGIDFLGFRFVICNNKLILKVRNNTKKRFIKKSRLINRMDNNKNIIINSCINHLSYGNCRGIIFKYFSF